MERLEETTFNLKESDFLSNVYELSKEYLWENFEESENDLQNDLICIVTLLIFIEHNFLPLDNRGMPLDLEKFSPTENWLSKYDKFNTMIFCLKEMEDMPIKLVLSPSGNIMLINALIEQSLLDTFTLGLHINKYVKLSKELKVNFENLEDLSQEMKNKIILPISNKIYYYHGVPTPTFHGLPEDLLQRIFLFLPLVDILNVSETCSRFHQIIGKNSLWTHLLKRDFNMTAMRGHNSKTTYQFEYQL